MQHDILILLNPPSAQVFVKDLDKEDIHNCSLTFDGTNLYYLHDTWENLEAKAKSSEQDQFAIVQYEPLLQMAVICSIHSGYQQSRNVSQILF